MTNHSQHRYTVEFRVTGKNLTPSRITDEIGLQPSYTRLAGDPRGQNGVFAESVWAFSGTSLNTDESPEWDSLEKGLLHVLQLLTPKKEIIWSYKNRFDTFWWCAHFQSSFDGGPTLSPELLRGLADFGVPLMLDNYMSEVA